MTGNVRDQNINKWMVTYTHTYVYQNWTLPKLFFLTLQDLILYVCVYIECTCVYIVFMYRNTHKYISKKILYVNKFYIRSNTKLYFFEWKVYFTFCFSLFWITSTLNVMWKYTNEKYNLVCWVLNSVTSLSKTL